MQSAKPCGQCGRLHLKVLSNLVQARRELAGRLARTGYCDVEMGLIRGAGCPKSLSF